MSDAYIVRRGGGGAGGLNFKIVGGTTRPGNPKENTIWVVTDQKITGWVFSFEEPTILYEGMVFFGLVATSPATMNILKKNEITLSFKTVKQVIDNELVKINETNVFINGEWVELSGTPIYSDGIWHEPYTGFTTYNCNITEYPDHLNLALNNKSGVYIENVNFDEFNTLLMDISSDAVAWITIAIADDTNWYDYGNNNNYIQYVSFRDTVTGNKIERDVYPLDVSNISGTHNIVINSWSSSLDIYSLTFE